MHLGDFAISLFFLLLLLLTISMSMGFYNINYLQQQEDIDGYNKSLTIQKFITAFDGICITLAGLLLYYHKQLKDAYSYTRISSRHVNTDLSEEETEPKNIRGGLGRKYNNEGSVTSRRLYVNTNSGNYSAGLGNNNN